MTSRTQFVFLYLVCLALTFQLYIHISNRHYSNRIWSSNSQTYPGFTGFQQTRISNRAGRLLFKDTYILTDFENFYHVSDDKLQDVLLNKHQFKMIISNEQQCDQDVYLLVFIHSAMKKSKERNIFRSTFLSVKTSNEKLIRHLFVLGTINNETLQEELLQENTRYHDIIQGNFPDDYKHITYKCVFPFYYTEKFCRHARFVLTIDDDVMANIPILIEYLDIIDQKNVSNFLDCRYFLSDGPEREIRNKYHVPVSEYPYEHYPPFCGGSAEIMTTDVMLKRLDASKKVPFFRIGDVYVGFLTWVAGIEMNRPDRFIEFLYDNLTTKPLPSALFYTNENNDVPTYYWENIWNAIWPN